MSSLFVDTSGWASLFVANQPYYPQAEQYFCLAFQEQKRIYTTNYIIAELVALVNSPLRVSRSRIFEIIDAIKTATYIEIVHIDDVTDTLAWTLCKSRIDKAWSLVDCTSFIVMQQMEIQEALTTDQHFEQAGFIRLLK
ncbi:MAG: type II toxin-antitoxin system VapC family toxin [Microcystis sp.]|uniref:type II toxin-antitoxin system VapC family toxin n=1 Tax=unclassified Microcystis TaxID=2643300 RepID=UPI001D3B6FB0|nr:MULTISPECIES: PIN domain-containing protein [unclassified Microcystis]MBE5231442.1 type II toxin-antitoxin system VapC family toxin [Microcystis aeruginosa PMC 728.11]MCA2538615.1 type II toxin-antitoxin system VapC family toxin [Microcystis sp. M54BS1]MCA2597205.1 type II toxin-antitoxin system VapC family toxin [Microcystis sp. M38BS1]MCA2610190.1 type II toxin-antitoxin system VapC family toxin [Microcystis sp. M27BS1]MCA2508089.1 type II toxin-antitoxin system VapC family toxin [Microcy